MDTSWIGPATQSADAARSNVWRVQEARHAERFSAHMAGTAYQRQMADMRAAGLNPMLAADGGGAPSPSGVVANIQSSDIGGAISSALQTKRLYADLQAIAANIDATKAQERKSNSETDLNQALKDKVNTETTRTGLDIPRAANMSRLHTAIGSIVDKVQSGASRWSEFSSSMQKRYDSLMQSIFGSGNSAKDAK